MKYLKDIFSHFPFGKVQSSFTTNFVLIRLLLLALLLLLLGFFIDESFVEQPSKLKLVCVVKFYTTKISQNLFLFKI